MGRSSWKTSCDALIVRQTHLSQSKFPVTKGTLYQPVNKVQEKDRAMASAELEQAACSPEDTGAGGSALSLDTSRVTVTFLSAFLFPVAHEQTVRFGPDLTEISQRGFFSRRLGRIQAAGRRNLLSASAEGCMNSTGCW